MGRRESPEMDRLKACYELREKGFKPNTTFTQFGTKMEIVSYPFPNARGGISIIVRRVSEPLSAREVGIPESEYLSKPTPTDGKLAVAGRSSKVPQSSPPVLTLSPSA
jgi:hypothetical protein